MAAAWHFDAASTDPSMHTRSAYCDSIAMCPLPSQSRRSMEEAGGGTSRRRMERHSRVSQHTTEQGARGRGRPVTGLPAAAAAGCPEPAPLWLRTASTGSD